MNVSKNRKELVVVCGKCGCEQGNDSDWDCCKNNFNRIERE